MSVFFEPIYQEGVYFSEPFPYGSMSEGAPGYSSGPGWDVCTGWGSIDGSELLKALQQITNVQSL